MDLSQLTARNPAPSASAAPDNSPAPDQQGKIPESEAGYMELEGAQKDADCSKVDVQGGVSAKLGCCNYFEHEEAAEQQFRCGTCEYVSGNGGPENKDQNSPEENRERPGAGANLLRQITARPQTGRTQTP